MIAGSDKELRLLDKTSSEFAKKELAPFREENDKYPFGSFFEPALKKAFEIEFFHATLPEAFGGIGQGMTALCVILYNICREDASMGGIIFTHTAAQELMLAADVGDVLKQIVLDKPNAYDALIAFPVFNNPSEIENMAMAKKKADGYVLSGKVEYVVLAGIAAHALIPGKIAGQSGYSFFLVNLSDAGIQKSPPVHSLGLHACPAVDLTLTNVNAVLLGKESAGADYFEQMADKMHVAAGAMSAGIMKGSFSEAFEYTRGRQQGGREIINWSEVRMILAGMAIAVTNAEMMISRACQAIDTCEKVWQACSRAAAITIAEAAAQATTDGIQLLGGVGYMKDFGQEKRFRDAKHIQALLGIAPLKKIKFIEKMIG
jgi:alkylation response protein AidB-like acyl-CoA dehydrogenase